MKSIDSQVYGGTGVVRAAPVARHAPQQDEEQRDDLRDLIDAWPTLDDAIRVQCSVCADMGERIVWTDDGVPVEPCPACAAGDETEAVSIIDTHWLPAKDGDERVAALYRKHYSCYQYADKRRERYGYRNRFLVMGPGEKMLLMTVNCDAIFGWRKFIDDSGQTGVNCAFFRNESPLLSSELILEAEQHAWARWPGERLYTYINAEKIRSTNPGFCFRVANWRKCGHTAVKGLLILEKYPPGATNAQT